MASLPPCCAQLHGVECPGAEESPRQETMSKGPTTYTSHHRVGVQCSAWYCTASKAWVRAMEETVEESELKAFALAV